MRTRNGSPRRRGPGLSDAKRAADMEPPLSAEQESTEQGDEEIGAGSDDHNSHEDPSDLGVENDDEDVNVENDGDDVDVENDAEEASNDEASNDGDVSVSVDALSTWHADWDTWQAYFSLYCKRTMQVLPVKETMSRAERNRRLLKTKKGENSSQLVPEEFDSYQRTYICTHGWKKRKSRSEGCQPRQHILLTDCPFVLSSIGIWRRVD
ncbi:hypothetical protein L914_12377 [Phytophthora nicotianae]|uniref:Uncharacterized protein n=1 Tax=Phytophthora nicotianae TaxID=4792 RepID=W2MZM7_PHYNI|nr:hypothetical protein L914_12377 [Phytophthora nicotianae]